MAATIEESLLLSKSDYRRFLAAVVGRQVEDISRYPLTSGFMTYALPSWGILGAAELPADGASETALPGIHRSAGVMALGQKIFVHAPHARYEPLRRVSRCISDEEKVGRSGRFRLVTVEREVVAARGVLASQRENYALKGAE